MPPTGQKIYVEAKQGENPKAFYEVLALLEEEDIEIPRDERAVLKTSDGAPWGVKSTSSPYDRIAQFEKWLGLSNTVMEDLAEERTARGTEDETQAMLANCW